jgi:hypothetical protein
MVPQEGIEPPTRALRMRCSTPELLRHAVDGCGPEGSANRAALQEAQSALSLANLTENPPRFGRARSLAALPGRQPGAASVAPQAWPLHTFANHGKSRSGARGSPAKND